MIKNKMIHCGLFVLVAIAILFVARNYVRQPSTQILTVIKKIDPDFNRATKYLGNKNVSMIVKPHSDKYILSFHRDIDLYSDLGKYHTKLEFMELDNDLLEHIKYPCIDNLEQFYQFPKEHLNAKSTAQDPRLIVSHDKIFVIYNDAVDDHNRRQVFIASLELKNGKAALNEITPITYNFDKVKDQKNWSPFVYNNSLHFIYNIEPYSIFAWDVEKKQITNVYKTATSAQAQWKFGTIRGGTPAIYIKDYDAYLTFFHSSLDYKRNAPKWPVRKSPPWKIYYMGALIFENKPPFRIKAITPRPLTFDGLYENKQGNYHIIFPSGIVENGGDILISAGYQDAEALILKVDKEELYKNFKFL